MTAATQPPPPTATADRFRCEAEVPDPPRDAAGRKQYWEDTVAEAVAELRRRLASTRDEKSFQALQMIVDLEKTRIRHKGPVAGTQVSGSYSSPLPPLEPFDGKKAEDLTPPAAPATLSVPERVEEPVPSPDGCGAPENAAPLNTPAPERGGGRGVGSSAVEPPACPSPPKPLRPIPLRERVKLQDGIHGHFHDHDDDWMLEPGRGRRARATRAARAAAAAEVVEPVLPLILPPPLPHPVVKNFDLFSVS